MPKRTEPNSFSLFIITINLLEWATNATELETMNYEYLNLFSHFIGFKSCLWSQSWQLQYSIFMGLLFWNNRFFLVSQHFSMEYSYVRQITVIFSFLFENVTHYTVSTTEEKPATARSSPVSHVWSCRCPDHEDEAETIRDEALGLCHIRNISAGCYSSVDFQIKCNLTFILYCYWWITLLWTE